MNNVITILDVMMVTFILGAIGRVSKTIELISKNGWQNVRIVLSTSKDDLIKKYERMDTLMSMLMNTMFIFLWCYIHFWIQ